MVTQRGAAAPTILLSFRDALAEHLAALGARDIERFARTLSASPELRVVGPQGAITTGYDAVRSSHARWFTSAAAWTFESTELWRQAGSDVGLSLHSVTYRDEPSAKPIRFLLLFAFAREADGGWRLVYDQNTPLQLS